MSENNNSFILDSAEKLFDDLAGMLEFVKEHEKGSRWWTDNDDTRAADVRFYPILDEPLMVPAQTASLRAQVYPKFSASDESYIDSMASQSDSGYDGSSQLLAIKGELWPVGMSAIKGLCEKAKLQAKGWDILRKEDPQDLAEVLNRLMRHSKGKLCVLLQDEKIRAVNSGRYAILPISEVLQMIETWVNSEYPAAKFVRGYTSHEFTSLYLDLSAYKNELLGNMPMLAASAYTPGVIIRTSNVGLNSVSVKPSLVISGTFCPMGNSIDTPHTACGDTNERTEAMRQKVKAALSTTFPVFKDAAMEIEDMKNVQVNNAQNAVLRGLKFCGFAKEPAYQAFDVFSQMYGTGICTAYDCYMSAIDAFGYAMNMAGQNVRKQIEIADSLARAVRYNWEKAGTYAGNFSW